MTTDIDPYDPVANGIGCYNDWIEYRRAKLLAEQRARRNWRIAAGVLAVAAIALSTSPLWAQEAFNKGLSWTEEERAQIERYYERVSPLSRASHWHDWDCCQSYRCFPARPGVVKWTPDGIAITHPDGDVFLYAEDDPIWKPKRAEGLLDPRYHICFEKERDQWVVLCGYGAEVQG